jgi:hypothetical protein
MTSDESVFMRFLVRNWIFFVVLASFLSCRNNAPTGPPIPDESKLAVFCVLNPEVYSQTLLLTRSLTHTEQRNGYSGDLEVNDAQVTLTGPGLDLEAELMPFGSAEVTEKEIRYGKDFIWGSGNFNYTFPGQNLMPGATYTLSVSSPELGEAFAEATIPGTFEITEINMDPDWSSRFDVPYDQRSSDETDEHFKVSWTASPGAKGYLIDFSVIDYDLSEVLYRNLNLEETRIDPSNEDDITYLHSFVQYLLADSSGFVNAPYQERILLFPSGRDGPQRGVLTRETSLEIPVKTLFELTDYLTVHEDTLVYHLGDHTEIEAREYYYRDRFIKRIRVYIYALNNALYDFTAFEYLQFDEGDVIGQDAVIPDVSNLRGNGIGILGASYQRSATSRLVDIRETDFGLRYEEYNRPEHTVGRESLDTPICYSHLLTQFCVHKKT